MKLVQYKVYWPKPSTYQFDTDKIKRLMKKRGWSEHYLAAKLKTSQPTVHRTIMGETRNERIQKAIARALGVLLEEILLKPDPKSEQSAAA